MKYYTEIGAQIKEIRNYRGLTQKALANKIGTVKSDISDIENGRKKISIDRMDNIAKALDTYLDINMLPR